MTLEYFEKKQPNSFFVKGYVDSYKPAYRIFIEKRKTAVDQVGSQGLFVLAPTGFKDATVTTSIMNPGSATLNILTNTLTTYFAFEGQNSTLNDRLLLKNTLASGTSGLSGAQGKAGGSPTGTTNFIYDFDKLQFKQKQIETALKQQESNLVLNSGFFLPNRDPSVNVESEIGRIRMQNPLLASLLTDTVLKEETKLQMMSLSTFIEEIDTGDLIYIDTYSHRKQKLLPAFTGVITRKAVSGGVNDNESMQLSIEDYSYFLKRSQYIMSPAVYDQAQRETIEGSGPRTEGGTASTGFQSQVTAFQTNLMNKCAFEIFLALFLCSRESENPFDYLDNQGRIATQIKQGDKVTKFYSILPLRAPLLSRIERILAYPFTKRIDTAWSFLQGTAKSRNDLIQEVARHLECEYFFSEEGVPVIKFPTRLDAFSFFRPINLIPGNNLGRTRIHDKELDKAKKTTKPKAGQPEALYLQSSTDLVLGDPDDKSSSSYQIEKQLITSSEYLTVGVTTENVAKATERINKIRFQKYQKRDWDDFLYVDPRSEYLTLEDVSKVAKSKNLNLRDSRLALTFGPGSTASGSLSAGLTGSVNTANQGQPPNIQQVQNARVERSRIFGASEKDKILSHEAAKGGEIPTIYPDELISWSWEDNIEELFTAGFISIDQHYILPQGTDQQTLMMNNHGAYFVDILNSQKYGYNYKELNPQFFRDPVYASLYVYSKLNMVSQDRYRGSVTCIDDPFIRRGMPVKIYQRRNLKVRKFVPARKISLYDVEALKKIFDLTKGQMINNSMRFNTAASDGLKDGEIIFEEREIFLPCIYYVTDVSRTYPVGDATPTMTLTLTAGRAELNSSEVIREGEDQWVRGFYYFYNTFLFAPKDNPDPIKSKAQLEKATPPPTLKPEPKTPPGNSGGAKKAAPEQKKAPEKAAILKPRPTENTTRTTTNETTRRVQLIYQTIKPVFIGNPRITIPNTEQTLSPGSSETFSATELRKAFTSTQMLQAFNNFSYTGEYNQSYSNPNLVNNLLQAAIKGYLYNLLAESTFKDLCNYICSFTFFEKIWGTPEWTDSRLILKPARPQMIRSLEEMTVNKVLSRAYVALNSKEKRALGDLLQTGIENSVGRILIERVIGTE